MLITQDQLKTLFFITAAMYFFLYATLSASPRNDIEQSLQQIMSQSKYSNVHVGIQINRLDSNQSTVLYEKNSTRSFVPASIIKVLLSAYAVDHWGADYQFQTVVGYNGYIQNGELIGNLIIQGKGNPTLTHNDLEQIATQLYRAGVRRVSGNIIYDNSFFDSQIPQYLPSAKYYYAPGSALNVNFNRIKLRLVSTNPLKILSVYPTSYERMVINANFLDDPLALGRPSLSVYPRSWGDEFVIAGNLGQRDYRSGNLIVSVTRPGLYTASVLKTALEAQNIQVGGHIIQGEAPSSMHVFQVLNSHNLDRVINRLNQDSDNMIASVLMKNIGAFFHSLPGTQTKGLIELTDYCKDTLGMKMDELYLEDGTGLSRNNQISPRNYSKLLDRVYRSPQLRDVIFEALLDQRSEYLNWNYKNLDILFKTGTLANSGVNTIAGFIKDRQTNNTYSFVIMANRYNKGRAAYTGFYTNPILEQVAHILNQSTSTVAGK